VVNWRKVGLGYIILSVILGLVIAMVLAMLPGGPEPFPPHPPGYEYDFWLLFYQALPISMVAGFLISPVFYICLKCLMD